MNFNSIHWVSGEDPAMQFAIKKAQQSFPAFEQAIIQDLAREEPEIVDSLVKYAFPTEKSECIVEHMFLSDFEYLDGKLLGILMSEPQYAENVEEGDQITIELNSISDWLYVKDGKVYGGYTFELIWKSFSDDEKQMYIQDPPFSWMDLS